MLCLARGINSKVVEKGVCCARSIFAGCLEKEICSQEPWDEKRREGCLPGQRVVRMHWLVEQEFLDCRSGAFAGSANAA